MMEEVPTKSSILDIPPSNEGGPVGRQGQQYQDYVGIPLLLEMLTDGDMVLVEFESHDDALIIRKEQTGDVVEFVQVKSDDLNQMWSCAKLCEQRGSGKDRTGTSIIEKSLFQDRGTEKSRFRIITKVDVHGTLDILTHPLNGEYRLSADQETAKLCEAIKAYHPEINSDNGNGVDYWVSNAVWTVAESRQAIAAKNYEAVDTYAKRAGHTLAPDQVHKLLKDIETLVREAGNRKFSEGRSLKQFKRDDFRDWFNSKLDEYSLGSIAAEKMKMKMGQDGISPELVNSAVELRRQYTSQLRNQGYMANVNGDDLAQQVRAVLLMEKAKLDAGKINENGEEFHNRCLGILDELDKQQPRPEGTRTAFLMGCMYDITDRCQHRFSKGKRS